MDELEEDMEPVRSHVTQQVEQGVQYCEEDLLPQENQENIQEFIQEAAAANPELKTELVGVCLSKWSLCH